MTSHRPRRRLGEAGAAGTGDSSDCGSTGGESAGGRSTAGSFGAIPRPDHLTSADGSGASDGNAERIGAAGGRAAGEGSVGGADRRGKHARRLLENWRRRCSRPRLPPRSRRASLFCSATPRTWRCSPGTSTRCWRRMMRWARPSTWATRGRRSRRFQKIVRAPLSADDLAKLCRGMVAAATDAVAADAFDSARHIGQLASTSSRRLNDPNSPEKSPP